MKKLFISYYLYDIIKKIGDEIFMKKILKNKEKNLKLTTLGFTLIELLAVIVILAVIALIATPMIMGVIDEARKGALERSFDNIEHTAELYFYDEYRLE